ncbi:hypothetical protein DFJ73DRAFT_845506, partial [Zopfochytrium polystomum]
MSIGLSLCLSLSLSLSLSLRFFPQGLGSCGGSTGGSAVSLPFGSCSFQSLWSVSVRSFPFFVSSFFLFLVFLFPFFSLEVFSHVSKVKSVLDCARPNHRRRPLALLAVRCTH